MDLIPWPFEVEKWTHFYVQTSLSILFFLSVFLNDYYMFVTEINIYKYIKYICPPALVYMSLQMTMIGWCCID